MRTARLPTVHILVASGSPLGLSTGGGVGIREWGRVSQEVGVQRDGYLGYPPTSDT